MRRSLRSLLPGPLLGIAIASRNRLLDAADTVLRRRPDMVPPRRIAFVGSGDFLAIGRDFLELFRELGGLRPEHHVLDVGCGIGRMAVPLTGYLSSGGRYEGFDIVPHGIRWCSDEITPRYPNFRFRLVEIRNPAYNPHGRVDAQEFRFPYASESFDFVFLTSVFTHMMPGEVDNYLGEVQRILKPGARCFITWFLLNAGTRESMERGRSSIDFRHTIAGCAVRNPSMPEEAVAYEESHARDLYRKHGLMLTEPIEYGGWSGRSGYRSYQDICIAQKPGPVTAAPRAAMPS